MKLRLLAALTVTHAANDFSTGVILGLVPYFVAERHYSYSAATGLILASTLFSSVIQPLFGVIADRYRFHWIIGTGMTLSGLGVGLSGLSHGYILTCVCIGASGVGTAAYHPEATRTARTYAGSSARGMSLFTVGGNIGVALGPLGVALALGHFGLRGTPFLIAPSLSMAIAYSSMRVRVNRVERANQHVQAIEATNRPRTEELDRAPDWRSFRFLIAIVVFRSIGTTGVNSFIALEIIKKFHEPTSFGAITLSIIGAGGIVGTVLGGELADRVGRRNTLHIAYIVAPTLLISTIFASSVALTVVLIALLGVTSYVPFSVQVTLGQEYLAHRIGTASGVTLGAGSTAGGAIAPLLGLAADRAGLPVALWIGSATLLFALLLSFRIAEPIIGASLEVATN